MNAQKALIETARWGKEWQSKPGWQSHTLVLAEAERIADGYISLLRCLDPSFIATDASAERKPAGLGIGSGAGHLEAALAARGLSMTASEWSEEGLQLIAAEQPSLPRRLVDLMNFTDRGTWNLILCRELYPFTRTNDHERQMAILSTLVEGLRPGGVLLLVGSDAGRPECMDYRRAMRELRRHSLVEWVFGPVLEPIAKRLAGMQVARSGYALAHLLGETAIAVRNVLSRRPPIAGIRIYVIQRRN